MPTTNMIFGRICRGQLADVDPEVGSFLAAVPQPDQGETKILSPTQHRQCPGQVIYGRKVWRSDFRSASRSGYASERLL